MCEIQCDNMKLYNSYIQNADEDDLLYSGCSVPSAHSIVDLATPHCVYRLSVGLIECCAFSTGLNILGDSEGVQIAALTICVPEARHPINPTTSDQRERSVGFSGDPSCVSKTRYRRSAVVYFLHTSIATQATSHCVYRLSVRLIGRCAFSTGICVQSRDYGDVETAVPLPFVPEARHPINPTLSDYGERSVG